MRFVNYLERERDQAWAADAVDFERLRGLVRRSNNNPVSAVVGPRLRRGQSVRLNNPAGAGLTQPGAAQPQKFQAALIDALEHVRIRAKEESANLIDAARSQKPERELATAFLRIEKFVNLNLRAIDELLKFHDRAVPRSPMRRTFLARVRSIEWIQEDFPTNFCSDYCPNLLPAPQDDQRVARKFVTNKYFVRNEDVPRIERVIRLHTKLRDRSQASMGKLKSHNELRARLYLDNAQCELYHRWMTGDPGAFVVRLAWFGSAEPEFVFVELLTRGSAFIERLRLREDCVRTFIRGEYSVEDRLAEMRAENATYAEQREVRATFNRIFRLIDCKQLRPVVQAHYTRQVFDSPQVSIAIEGNLDLIQAHDDIETANAGAWYRHVNGDYIPDQDASASPITRQQTLTPARKDVPGGVMVQIDGAKRLVVGHSILEVQTDVMGSDPEWLRVLLRSDRIMQVADWNTFLHGAAALMAGQISVRPEWSDAPFPTVRRGAAVAIMGFFNSGRNYVRKTLRRSSPPGVKGAGYFDRPEGAQPQQDQDAAIPVS